MIRFRDKILEDYFIDPETAVITNSNGEVQETKNKDGRPYFHCMAIHRIQIHTHLGYKKGYDIHHLDENKMNNSLQNLVYLKRNEHAMIHKKGEKLSEETRKKMSDAQKGKTSPNKGKMWINNGIKQRRIHFDEEIPEGFVRGRIKLSEETRKKMSESQKGTKNPLYGKRFRWINNGIEQRYIHFDDDIPEGFSRGRLKKGISKLNKILNGEKI